MLLLIRHLSLIAICLLCFHLGITQGSHHHHVHINKRADSLTGDSHCVTYMCISATVNGSTVEYVLQSTGLQSLGWMAMGFGHTMTNSPMVIMWPNADSSITLSQRRASSHVMPSVDSSPPRIATLSTSLSSVSGTQPRLVYTIPANSDTQQNVIWAFATVAPSSAAVDATLQQHISSGTFTLDLTTVISSGSTTASESAISTSASSASTSTPSSSSGSPGIPLLEKRGIVVLYIVLSFYCYMSINLIRF